VAASRAGKARALGKKVLTAAVVIGVLIWVLSDPTLAGDTVHSWIFGLIDFFRHLI
jgi:hypothetical protein